MFFDEELNIVWANTGVLRIVFLLHEWRCDGRRWCGWSGQVDVNRALRDKMLVNRAAEYTDEKCGTSNCYSW